MQLASWMCSAICILSGKQLCRQQQCVLFFSLLFVGKPQWKNYALFHGTTRTRSRCLNLLPLCGKMEFHQRIKCNTKKKKDTSTVHILLWSTHCDTFNICWMNILYPSFTWQPFRRYRIKIKKIKSWKTSVFCTEILSLFSVFQTVSVFIAGSEKFITLAYAHHSTHTLNWNANTGDNEVT